MTGGEFTATPTAGHDEPYTEATVRRKHTLHSDEPEWLPAGAGDDAHPAPVDYLLTSLASCQVSVLQQCLEANGVAQYAIECGAELDEWGTDDVPAELPPTPRTGPSTSPSGWTSGPPRHTGTRPTAA